MVQKPSKLNKPGLRYRDFEVEKCVEITELQCFMTELVHLPTGAKVMHIANEDVENLFCLSFQTLPNSSNGVAHILEHTVLCGSKKFPIKDPFFAMTRRSLNTYMNALTGADFTCYPAATQVPKDFYNLLDVYLDAVFHPNLNKMSFLQEGHRLEFAVPNDPNSPLEFKGIVYNEMKGALSSPMARLNEFINQALFPNITYGVNSGGDPKVIPQLTFEELKQFHDYFYHPSRCLFYFYGNLPLADHLDFIAEKTLEHVEKAPALPPLPRQPRFPIPRSFEYTYPVSDEDEESGQTYMAFGWLTSHVSDQEELLALCMLEIILMDTDASPLKMALLKSGYCKGASIYMESDISEAPLVIILRGCQSNKIDHVEALIRTTLKEIITEGIPLEMVENAMHQLEFFRSEIVGDHSPFGLSLFMRSALLKQHEARPETGLKIHSILENLRCKNLADPHYLTSLISKYLLDNTHFVRIVMKPDKELAAKEQSDERAVLDKIKAQLTPKEIDQIVKQASELAVFQENQEHMDNDILPKVMLSDVSPTPRDLTLQIEKVGNLEVFHHTCFTNEIIYADLIYDLPEINEEDLPYVRLLSTLIAQMGCGKRNYQETLEYIQAHTGGTGASLALNVQAKDFNQFKPSLYIRGKALHRKAHKLFPLIQQLASSNDFSDISRLKEVILKHYSGLQSSLTQNSLRYATNLATSQLSVGSKINNAWYGLDYFLKMREIATNFDTQVKFLVKKLQELQENLLCLDNPRLVITCDASMYEKLKTHGFYGLKDLPTKSFKPWIGKYLLPTVPSQGRTVASPVAFISKVLSTVPYAHPDAPALNLAPFLFDNLVLHTRLREQGGAYGGGAVCNSMMGNFYFYSYRDPNIYSTLQAFKDSVKTIVEGRFNESDLEEAKLEMIQYLDSPIPPGSRGDRAYGWLCEGKTFELRQAFRSKLLSLTREEIIETVKKHILPKIDSGTTVVFSGRELLEKENTHLIKNGMPPLKIESI